MMWHGIGADNVPETLAEKLAYYAGIIAVTVACFAVCVIASGIL